MGLSGSEFLITLVADFIRLGLSSVNLPADSLVRVGDLLWRCDVVGDFTSQTSAYLTFN